jgi:endoplasmic reticulum chaperone BiP
MTKLIPRNTVLPTKKSQIVTTAVDSQFAVLIKVYEGECSLAKIAGKLELTGIPQYTTD